MLSSFHLLYTYCIQYCPKAQLWYLHLRKMADPVKRPLKWSKSYPTYAEKHDMYRVFQELLKELIIQKPKDPLAFIRDEIENLARTLHAPRIFLIGPTVVTQSIGRDMAHKCGAKFLTLADIVEASPLAVRGVLGTLVTEPGEDFDNNLRILLVAAIKQRLAKSDCHKHGYVLYGFPQNADQAKCAQQYGLLPRQVFILLPNQHPEASGKRKSYQDLVSEDQVKLPELDFERCKGVMDAYPYDICKTIYYEKWIESRKQDIEAEFLAHVVSIKPAGSPYVPKVLLIGPPSSGKSTIAEELCRRYSFVNVDFMELVRGATALNDDVSIACKKYLGDLKPMNDECIRVLLQRRMLREDCDTQGWVLHGFPDTAKQLKLLELLHISPNRIFLLYCPEDMCNARLLHKRNEVMKRRVSLSGDSSSTERSFVYHAKSNKKSALPVVDEQHYGDFPYGKTAFRMRYEAYTENLAEITAYFGTHIIYVDATQKKESTFQFMEDAVMRPPVIRFPTEPTEKPALKV